MVEVVTVLLGAMEMMDIDGQLLRMLRCHICQYYLKCSMYGFTYMKGEQWPHSRGKGLVKLLNIPFTWGIWANNALLFLTKLA